jgi:hypothetical protein
MARLADFVIMQRTINEQKKARRREGNRGGPIHPHGRGEDVETAFMLRRQPDSVNRTIAETLVGIFSHSLNKFRSPRSET